MKIKLSYRFTLRFRKIYLWLLLFFLGLLLTIIFAGQRLQLPLTDGWVALYRGIDWSVSNLNETGGQGKMMAVRVQWDTPNLRLEHRRPDFPLAVNGWEKPASDRLFRLELADFALARQKAAILVNTTTYYPAEWWQSYPGAAVHSGETLVWDGQASHRHPESYLLWWDFYGNARLETEKPPPIDLLKKARLAIGVQGVAIKDGKSRYEAIAGMTRNQFIPRTFIGIDAQKKQLFLIAFEAVSVKTMIDQAIALGVMDGAMVDSGDATHLLIGKGAKNVPSHTGVRHGRPLGGYLMIFGDRLP